MKDKECHGGNLSEVRRRLGVKDSREDILDFSVNLNMMGPPQAVMDILAASDLISLDYPDPYAREACESLSRFHGISSDMIIAGNGATELFQWIVLSCKPQNAVWLAPSYSGYNEICKAVNINAKPLIPSPWLDVFLNKKSIYCPEALLDDFYRLLSRENPDFVFLCNPNNPTGCSYRRQDVLSIVEKFPSAMFLIDESFIDFIPNAQGISLVSVETPDNLVIVKSMTKFFSIAGLRLGFAFGNENVISNIRKTRLPWSVNALAQRISSILYSDMEYINQSRIKLMTERAFLIENLRKIKDLAVFESDANFVLCRLINGEKSQHIQRKLLERGILIRTYEDAAGLDESFFRVAVRKNKENEILFSTLIEIMEQKPNKVFALKKNKPLMVVGTTSSAGKSVITAAFCRFFSKKGLNVAPFKAQNMALNSFVTLEGGEIGRAQAFQAAACRIAPHTDMNPILLKPTGRGSQVILCGKSIGDMTASEYYAKRDEMRQFARDSFDRLYSRYDMIVMEGAGSPAEINLRNEDIVNLDMADYAGADAILVADIDRGGVFASVLGTMKLVPVRYRSLIKGIVINKFRGDESILFPGLKMLEDMTGAPVLGVIPWIEGFVVEEEDSLGLEGRGESLFEESALDIAVVRLPKISNYTDILPLESAKGVRVRYPSEARRMGRPDLVIIPGSKNTRDDLCFLKESGFAARISALARSGTPVFGLCGGYQMLGLKVIDMNGVEGDSGETEGLGLLNVVTEMLGDKELAQVRGIASGLPFCDFCDGEIHFQGYEIHMGKTYPVAHDAPLMITSRRGISCEERAGSISKDKLVFGCYVHGIFDEPDMLRALVQWLFARRGEEYRFTKEILQDPWDKMSDILETKLDLGRIGYGL